MLYQDSNCNGVLDSGEPQISGALTVSAAQKVCLIVKVLVPAGAVAGAQSSVSLSAAFVYTNASPALTATLAASDVTTVGAPGTLSLAKLVSNLTRGGSAATAVSANPGDSSRQVVSLAVTYQVKIGT